MFGDLLLFLFIKDVFARDVREFLSTHKRKARFFSYFHFGFFKWLLPLIGALIIVSPLPDELGLTLLGLSKERVIFILPLTFLLNFVSILLIGLIVTRL